MRQQHEKCEVCNSPAEVTVILTSDTAKLGDDGADVVMRSLCPVCAGKVMSFIDRMSGKCN